MPASIEHWFDFTCPYCYLAQDRDRSGRYRGRPTDGPAVRIPGRGGGDRRTSLALAGPDPVLRTPELTGTD
jgi:hypothetical protein